MVTEIVSWHLVSITYFVKTGFTYNNNTFIDSYCFFYCYDTICTVSELILRSIFFLN